MSSRTITDRVQLVTRFAAASDGDARTVPWQAIAAFLDNDRFSAGTRQTYFAHLSAWFGWLVLMDYRVDNPTAKIRAPKTPRRRPRPLTVAQLDKLLRTRMNRRTQIMVVLAAYEGLRVSEIAKIRGEHFHGGMLRVVGKGGVVDDVPVHEIVAGLAAGMPRIGYWFPSHVNTGEPVTGKSVSAMLSKLMARAGVPGTPHALRHFFGTHTLRTSGGNLALVQRLMRHASVATTAMYTGIDEQDLRAAVNGLPVPLALRAG